MSVNRNKQHVSRSPNPKLTMGIGWIPAIERYLEVIGEIDRANDLPQSSLYGISERVEGLEFAQVLPVCDDEQAILECVMNRWVCRLCRVCGGESHSGNGFCLKHDVGSSVLCSVCPVTDAGIPTAGKRGAIVASKLRGTGFFVAYHRYPERFLPPSVTGSCLDQVGTEWEGLFFAEEARYRISQTMSEHELDFLPMDVYSYDSLCGPVAVPVPNVIDLYSRSPKRVAKETDLIEAAITREQVQRSDARKGYWTRWSRLDPYRASEEQWRQALRWVEDYVANRLTPYITGFSALDFWGGRHIKRVDVCIAGIHLTDSLSVLADQGIRQDASFFSELGIILPTPSIASPERAVFDLLHHYCVMGLESHELSLIPLYTLVDIDLLSDYVYSAILPGATKDKMRQLVELF